MNFKKLSSESFWPAFETVFFFFYSGELFKSVGSCKKINDGDTRFIIVCKTRFINVKFNKISFLFLHKTKQKKDERLFNYQVRLLYFSIINPNQDFISHFSTLFFTAVIIKMTIMTKIIIIVIIITRGSFCLNLHQMTLIIVTINIFIIIYFLILSF